MFQKNTKKTVVQPGLLSAFCLLGVQAMIVVLISLIWGWYSFSAMTSTWLGGLVSLLPNALFAYRFFQSGRASPKKIVRTFYSGEIIKLIMTVALAILMFTQINVLIFPFLTGLVGATLGLWFAPILLNTVNKPKAVIS